MNVHVDQARRYEQSCGIDFAVTAASGNISNERDSPILEQQIGQLVEAGCGVYNAAVAYCDGTGKSRHWGIRAHKKPHLGAIDDRDAATTLRPCMRLTRAGCSRYILSRKDTGWRQNWQRGIAA